MSTIVEQCGTCRFSRAETDPDVAAYTPSWFCHRAAPRPDFRSGDAFWPEVSEEDWCGEFVLDASLGGPKP